MEGGREDMGNGNIWLDRPFLLPACCPCRRWPLPARVTRGLVPRVAWLWVQSWAESAFLLEGPRLVPALPGTVPQGCAPHPAASLAAWCSDPQVLGDGRLEVCGARLGCHAEFGALPQLPRPVCSSAGCWELEQPCCTCAYVMGTRLAAEVSVSQELFSCLCSATASLPCSSL